ncbi:MAG: IPT/TIG domain-containing protein [Myxococcota bacterium]|nr:IPT/TIG domain-containing protein [Myxococcota bacterium]
MNRILSALLVVLPAGGCDGAVGSLPPVADPAGGHGPLTLERVMPAAGPAAGGTTVQLTGTGFINDLAVVIGVEPCRDLTVVSAVELACTTPGSAAGVYAVTVTRRDDGATAFSSFTYEGSGGVRGEGDTGADDTGSEAGTGAGGTGGDGGAGSGGGAGGTGGATTPVDYCHLQYPCGQAGDANDLSDPTYIWVFQRGVTEGIGQGAGIVVDVGVGPDGTHPVSGGWTWTRAVYNEDKDGLSPLANDEYGGTFRLPASGGSYDFCGRVSADGGASWTYCDAGGTTCGGGGSADGYRAAEAGQLTIAP